MKTTWNRVCVWRRRFINWMWHTASVSPGTGRKGEECVKRILLHVRCRNLQENSLGKCEGQWRDWAVVRNRSLSLYLKYRETEIMALNSTKTYVSWRHRGIVRKELSSM
ncbi:hypothetical protein L798_12805 [Zootermopsis nevadensis]|uniref:Uncharacterized protein n=1 Tax=Zootermopsis nevadensis TaxID=136037 RepID=A0A067RFQ1_ZOONE|nr:hypothetical protein L798_12805 [Zootermopsis nevadensis]